MTTKTIPAIYENGIIRPLRKLPLHEHESIQLQLVKSSVAESTFAIIKVGKRVARQIAESPRFSPFSH